MLSYKEYKQLNESLNGAYNLGLRSQAALVPPVGATGASEILEKDAEPSIEEAKKCGKMMKKKMSSDEMEDDEVEDDVVKDEEDEEEEEDEDEEDEEDEEEDDDEEEEEEDEEEEDSEDKYMKKSMKKPMKKKSKKEWSEIVADFESLLEDKNQDVVNQVKNNLENIKKLLETKEMTEEEKAWWTSVNSQLASPGDLGFAPVGKVTQALR
jgi:hypothetical protein